MTQPSPYANYTSDEIQAAVEKLVLSTIRRPYDTLGVRRTDISFNDVQQAAAGVFILYPNSPFYVVQLGLKRLNDLISQEVALIQQLSAAIASVGRQVLPVKDVSPLFNAQAALQELASAGSLRGGSYTDITKLPAYQRYASNVQTFLDGPGQNIKQSGNIVYTPLQARQAIPVLVTQLGAAHQNLINRVNLLVNAIADYNTINLPNVVATSVLSKSASLIGSDANALNGLTPDQRLAMIRDVVLNLLATKAVVGTLGSFTAPSDFYSLTGVGTAYSDADHLAEPAVLTADLTGGKMILPPLVGTNLLTLAVDGGAPTTIVLNSSTGAVLLGSANDSTFLIGDGTSPDSGPGTFTPNNNVFKIKVDSTPYVATLTVSGLASVATLTGTGDTTTAGWYGPGGALDGKTLQLVVDNAAPFSVTFVAPVNAGDLMTQIGAVTSFGLHAAAAYDVGNRTEIVTLNRGPSTSLKIYGGTALSVLGFTAGQSAVGSDATRTADEVATDINAVLPFGVQAEGYYSPLRFSGVFTIPAGTDTTWPTTGNPAAAGVVAGDTVNVLFGPNAGFWPITAVTSSSITISGVTVAQGPVPVEIGPKNRKLKISCVDLTTQIPAETTITVYSDDAVSQNTLRTLGFSEGASSQCLLSTPDTVATDINAKTGLVTASTKTVTALGPITTAHADIHNDKLLVFSKARVVGNASFAGTTLTLTVTSVTTSGVVSTGDVLAPRSGSNVGYDYTLSDVNGSPVTDYTLQAGDVVTATGTFAGSNEPGVDVELGLDAGASKYRVVTIPEGPNGGTYFMAGQGTTRMDVLLHTALPIQRSFVSPTSDPIVLTASIGDMHLVLTSKNATTASAVTASGLAATLFFSSVPATAQATTSWLLLPSVPRGLQAGDVLEIYTTDYQTPAYAYPILQVLVGAKLIQIGPDVGTGKLIAPGTYTFTPQPVPFARLRFGTKNTYAQTQAKLQTWLIGSVNQPVFLENFNALINPLLVSTSPTAGQIGAAQAALDQVYAAIEGDPTASLASIVPTYTVESVSAVDVLLRSFIEKGSDRAMDLLLEGQFSTFFSLSNDGVSYSGAFQEATRAVAMNDLPVRRYNRFDASRSRLRAQAQSPDYEFTANSVTEVVGGPQVSPPSDYGTSSDYGTTTGEPGAAGQPAKR